MIISGMDFVTADNSVHSMEKIVRETSGDIGEKRRMRLGEFFDYVKAMPYRQDPKGVEVLSRPKHTMNFAPSIGRDCKKQSVIMASWARENGVPYRFVIVSTRATRAPHHVFISMFINGKWIDTDATYKHYRIGDKKVYTYRRNFEIQKDAK